MMHTTILEKIENELQVLMMEFGNDSWRKAIPYAPGWYFIETNTPPEAFLKVGKPRGMRHYNIPQKTLASLKLKKLGVCILPSENSFYFVYSGEAQNLKSRAREHVSGHRETGCLALRNYPLLHQYQWRFHFSLCPFDNSPDKSKLLRIYGEQLWRAKHGWPILCGK
jgi:hypothetical protein